MEIIKRYFPPGSEWLYYKLYVGSSTAETFLTQQLKPFLDELLVERIIDKWFFINYGDPDRHIRLRLHLLDPKKDLGGVIIRICDLFSALIKERILTRFDISIYKRELERYGFRTIDGFENLFFLDSSLVVEVLCHTREEPGQRWLWSLRIIDFYMDEWGLDLYQKLELFKILKSNFGAEMGVNTAINKQISGKYRKDKTLIENSLSGKVAILEELLVGHSIHCTLTVNQIKENRDLLDPHILFLTLEGYIHMHCNRIFSSRQRINEWVLYDFLYQYYRSKVAQKNTVF